MEENTKPCISHVIFDIDGVLVDCDNSEGDKVMPDAPKVIEDIRVKGCAISLLTNSSSRSRIAHVSRLEALGFKFDESEIMTSAYATALYFKQNEFYDCKIFVIGEDGIREELKRADIGINFVENPESGPLVDALVVGIDKKFSYAKIAKALRAIERAMEQNKYVLFIATNCDSTYIENKVSVPGAGCMVAAVEGAIGRSPDEVIGKPSTFSLKKIIEYSGIAPSKTLVVGDRLDTDILVGLRIRAHTVLVQTGVNKEDDVQSYITA